MSIKARRLQSILSQYLAAKKSVWNGYGFAFVATLIASILVYEIWLSEEVLVASILLAATVLAAVQGGFGPAVFSTLIGTVFIEIWLLESSIGWPTTISGYVRVFTHLLVSLGVSLLVSLLRQSFYVSEELRNTAESVNREKDAILSVVAHDLKNPIGSAIGFVEVLLDPSVVELSDEMRQKFLGNIRRSCNLSLAIINDLQEYSCLGSDRQKIALERIDVAQELNCIVASMELHAKKKRIELKIETPKNAVFVESDVKLLNRAVQNILENAIKYSPLGSSVQIVCNYVREKECVEIEIEDQGPGILPADQEKIFEPFYRTPNRPTGGETSTGLGLPSVKAIADMLGIEVRLRSAFGCGSTFILSIPKACRSHDQYAGEQPLKAAQLGPV